MVTKGFFRMEKILIVSNECLSKQSSNGRTLLNLLAGYPSASLAQFYLHGSPDKSVCSNYFRVSDMDAMNAFLGRKIKNKNQSESSSGTAITKKRRPCSLLVLRNIIWDSFRWWNADFDMFLESFNPDVIVFQAGDSPFMYKIVERIRKKLQIPVIIFSTENYVLKHKLFNSAKKYSPWHLFLHSSLKKQHSRLMKSVSYCVYNTEVLKNDYNTPYPCEKSVVIYVSSDFVPKEKPQSPEGKFTLLYCGNLGVGRAEMLCEVSQVLSKIDLTAQLIICGSFSSKEEKDMVCENSNVIYKGVVPYEQVSELMQKSSMLLHCENPDRLVNLRTAFSTKIADSLASGKPFLVYASHEYPFVQYLEKNEATHIAGNQNELEAVLGKCISDEIFLKSKVKNALSLAEKNHNIDKNAQAFQNIINAVCKAKINL